MSVAAFTKMPLWKIVTVALLVLVTSYAFYDLTMDSSEYSRVSGSIERQAVAIDDGYLSSYVGTYQLRPGFEVEVSYSKGSLYAQATNQNKIEFLPASNTVFFNEVTPMLLKFEPEPSGMVNQFKVLEAGRSRYAQRIR